MRNAGVWYEVNKVIKKHVNTLMREQNDVVVDRNSLRIDALREPSHVLILTYIHIAALYHDHVVPVL